VIAPQGSTNGETFVRTLYADVAGPLFSYVVRLTGDRSRAEDVVQEALLPITAGVSSRSSTSSITR
jgi:RNA polymerase sigma-70 factor (ECF subfamily)